jgi:peptidoglycan/xylan/chitin deacetylase (PgdA/CDA1 family)
MGRLSVSEAKVAAKRSVSRLYQVCGGGAPGEAVRVLMYHSIAPQFRHDPEQMTTPISLFREQMAYLAANGYRVVEASDIVERLRHGQPIPRRTIVLTFDDGYADNLELALPVLQQHRFPATVFFVTAALDGRLNRVHTGWDGTYLGWEQAREMLATGLIAAGCHSATHRRIAGLDPDRLAEETEGAKRRLEDRLGGSVFLFAYPFGAYDAWDRAARTAVEAAGFAGAFTTVFGANTEETDRFLLRRSRVSWCERIPEFELLLQGGYDWYAFVQRCQARPTRFSSSANHRVSV